MPGCPCIGRRFAARPERDRGFFLDRLRTMAAGRFADSARSLAAFDEHDNTVAVATVWSAGPDRPGLLEPTAVHRDHWGRGYGTAITGFYLRRSRP